MGIKLLADWFGEPFKVMLAGVCAKYGLDPTDDERKLWSKWEEAAIIAAVHREGAPARGVTNILDTLIRENKYGIAVVSSSSLTRIRGCLEGVNFQHYFDDRHIFSANSSLPVPNPKPDPEIYEFALESLGISAKEALAVEDSLGGVRSAVGAGIDTLGYLGCLNQPVHQAQLAHDFDDNGVKASMRSWTEFFGLLAKAEA